MKITRTNLSLFLVAIVLLVACYFFGKKSIAYKVDSDCPNGPVPCFYVSDAPREWNYWDAASIGCLVLGSSSIVASIWITWRRG